jgi:hypothetical protein
MQLYLHPTAGFQVLVLKYILLFFCINLVFPNNNAVWSLFKFVVKVQIMTIYL